MKIILGEGHYLISSGKLENESTTEAVLFEYITEAHDVGEYIPSKINSGIYNIKEQDVLVTFKNIESARVLQDAVNLSILRMIDSKNGELK